MQSNMLTLVHISVFIVGVIAIVNAIVVEKVWIIPFDVRINNNGQVAA